MDVQPDHKGKHNFKISVKRVKQLPHSNLITQNVSGLIQRPFRHEHCLNNRKYLVGYKKLALSTRSTYARIGVVKIDYSISGYFRAPYGQSCLLIYLQIDNSDSRLFK